MGPFIQIIIIQQMTAINCSELESNLVSPNLTSINLIKSSKKDWGPYLILDIQQKGYSKDQNNVMILKQIKKSKTSKQ